MPSRTRLRPGTAVTALALLVLGLLALWLVLRRPEAKGPPPSIRPVTPALLHAEMPVLLAWEGGLPPFTVSLVDATGGLVWQSGRLASPVVEIPAAARAGLRTGVEYRWSVLGSDDGGAAFRSAEFPLELVDDLASALD